MIALHIGLSHDSEAWWASWTADPIALAGVTTAGLLYYLGMRRSTGSRRRLHPWWRPLLFYTGLATVLLALTSPLDAQADELFFMHMVQHLLLLVVAPPLVLLSAPMIPMLRGTPRSIRRGLVAPLARSFPVRRGLRLVTLPLVAWSIYVVTLLGWHVSAPYDWAVENEAVHTLEHLTFAAAAFLFWWNVIDPIPLRPNLPYMARLPYIFVTTVPNFTLGAFLAFSDAAWYTFYKERPLRWGLSPLEDQQLGGVIMWVPGSLVLLAALGVVFALTLVREEQRQRLIEARARLGPGRALDP